MVFIFNLSRLFFFYLVRKLNKKKSNLYILLQLFNLLKNKFTRLSFFGMMSSQNFSARLYLLQLEANVTTTKSALSYDPTVFDSRLIKQFEPMIHKLIKQQVYGYQSSDVCYEWDDLYQECLIHLHTATLQYDNTRGMKFENFVFLKLASRLGNFRNKISKNNFKTSNFTDLNSWAITGSEVDNSQFEGNSTQINSKLQGHVEYDQQDILNEILDAKTVLHRLQGDRLRIFEAHYIEGKTVKEICEENSHLKYYQIRRVLKYLEQLHSTMIEGNVCLN